MKRDKYLIINTGSTSTKITIFNEAGEKILDQNVTHSAEEIGKYKDVQDQYDFRCENLLAALKDYGFSLEEMHAIGARCGALIPVYEGGIFLIDDYMCQALIDTPVRHAANLGAQIAKKFADSQGIKAYIADPDVLDEMTPIARITGLKGVERSALWHCLSSKAVVRKIAA